MNNLRATDNDARVLHISQGLADSELEQFLESVNDVRALLWDLLDSDSRRNILRASKHLREILSPQIRRLTVNLPSDKIDACKLGQVNFLRDEALQPSKGMELVLQYGRVASKDTCVHTSLRDCLPGGVLEGFLDSLIRHRDGSILHHVGHLAIHGVTLHGSELTQLSAVLEELRAIQSLEITNSALSLATIFALPHLQSIISLKIERCSDVYWWGSQWHSDFEILGGMFSFPALTSLVLDCWDVFKFLEEDDVTTLVAACPGLRSLSLRRADICNGGVEALLEHLPHLTHLEALYISPQTDLSKRPCSWKMIQMSKCKVMDLAYLPLRDVQPMFLMDKPGLHSALTLEIDEDVTSTEVGRATDNLLTCKALPAQFSLGLQLSCDPQVLAPLAKLAPRVTRLRIATDGDIPEWAMINWETYVPELSRCFGRHVEVLDLSALPFPAKWHDVDSFPYLRELCVSVLPPEREHLDLSADWWPSAQQVKLLCEGHKHLMKLRLMCVAGSMQFCLDEEKAVLDQLLPGWTEAVGGGVELEPCYCW